MSNLIGALANVSGAEFASFTYTARGTGEVSKYLVNLGVDFTKVYTDDLATLEALIPALSGIELEAATEIRDSIAKSLRAWEDGANNPDSTSAHAYTDIPGVPGMKVHTDTGDLHLLCMVVKKEVLVPGEYRVVKSRPKTIAKQAIERTLRRSKIRQFALPGLSRAALQGQVIVFP